MYLTLSLYIRTQRQYLTLNLKSFIMHNREITHKVKTDSLSKTQLIAWTKSSFCCHVREAYDETKTTEQSFL